MELQELREEIDRLDTVLLDAFLKRMKVSEAVAEYKMEHHLEILNTKREQDVIAKVRAQSGDMADYSQELFEKIMEISRNRQQELMKEEK